MTHPTPEPTHSFWSRLPSFVWIFVFVGGIAAFIGGIAVLFYALSHIEGCASVLMLAVPLIVLRALARPNTGIDAAPRLAPSRGQGFATALGITFFALMGMAIDQPGNVIYNKPIEWLFCPSGSELQRGINVTNPLPERTDITQEFSCVDTVNGQRAIVDRPEMLKVVAVRFVEYVLIGYVLLGLLQLYSRIRAARSPALA